MPPAEPSHLQRLGVIVVVLLDVIRAAGLARLWNKFSPPLVHIRVRPRVGFAATRITHIGVAWPMFAHPSGVTGAAIRLPWPIPPRSALACRGAIAAALFPVTLHGNIIRYCLTVYSGSCFAFFRLLALPPFAPALVAASGDHW